MSAKWLQILLIALIFQNVRSTTHRELNETKNMQTKRQRNIFKKWEFETDDRLEYPRGDKVKLRHLSKIWSDHYACLSRVARRVTSSGRLPAVYKAAIEGAVVTLPCSLCVAPGERNYVRWLQAKSLESAFDPMVHQYHVVAQENGDLSIYGVRSEDSGVYKCRLGHSVGGLVILEVVDPNRGYNVVKSHSTDGPYPAPPTTLRIKNLPLIVFTAWSRWSECSVCGAVGRRRRHGMCYVKLDNKLKRQVKRGEIEETSAPDGSDVSFQRTMQLFAAFPGGIPCRSRHLPSDIRMLPKVRQRPDEILLKLCKINCDIRRLFEVRTTRGALLERANNSGGVFSLRQPLPLPAPKYQADILFVARREPVNLTCPGLSVRDVPVSWRVGTKFLNPRTVDRESRKRVHLNARDQIVIANVKYSDANLYSCWQRDELLGTVKLEVWEGNYLRWNHHVLLWLLLIVTATMLRAIDRVASDKRRKLGML